MSEKPLEHGPGAQRPGGTAGVLRAGLGHLRRPDARHAAGGARPDHRRHRAADDRRRPRRRSSTSPGWSPPTCWRSTVDHAALGQARRPLGRKPLFQIGDRDLPGRLRPVRHVADPWPSSSPSAPSRASAAAGSWCWRRRSSATSCRPGSAAGTRATSARSSASPASPGRCSAGSSSTTSTWRWVFYINMPDRRRRARRRSPPSLPATRRGGTPQIDYARHHAARPPSSTCIVLVTTLGRHHAGPGARPLIIGAGRARRRLPGRAFVVVERRAAEPVLPLRLFAQPRRSRVASASASSSASRCSARSPTCRSTCSGVKGVDADRVRAC